MTSRPARTPTIMLLGTALFSAVAGAVWLGQDWLSGQDRSAQLALGRTRYAEHCAACHGASLEGQPNWKERSPNGRMPAPPHDATGHTWHHADSDLFLITKKGVEAVVPGYESDMPAFEGVLTDEEIRAVLAYIKGTWPQREREYQEARSRSRQ